MKTLLPFVLIAISICLSSCSTGPSDLNSLMDSDIRGFVNTLNQDARQEGAPFRYRISDDGYFIEKYPSSDFDEILEEVDVAIPCPSLANDALQLNIYEKISDYEVKNGQQAHPDIAETRVLRKMNGYYREAWIIVRHDNSVKEYLVTYKSMLSGGMNGTIYPL